jgi:hypothetical protein
MTTHDPAPAPEVARGHLTDEELRAIRERAEKATPGPFIWEYDREREKAIALSNGPKDVLLATGDHDSAWLEVGDADSLLFMVAQADILRLCAEVESLRLALDRAQGERDRMALALRLIMAEARNRGGDPLVLRWANLAEAALSPTEAPRDGTEG